MVPAANRICAFREQAGTIWQAKCSVSSADPISAANGAANVSPISKKLRTLSFIRYAMPKETAVTARKQTRVIEICSPPVGRAGL